MLDCNIKYVKQLEDHEACEKAAERMLESRV